MEKEPKLTDGWEVDDVCRDDKEHVYEYRVIRLEKLELYNVEVMALKRDPGE